MNVVAEPEERHIELAEGPPKQGQNPDHQGTADQNADAEQDPEGELLADGHAHGRADEAKADKGGDPQARPVDQVDDLSGQQGIEGHQLPERVRGEARPAAVGFQIKHQLSMPCSALAREDNSLAVRGARRNSPPA